MRRGVAIVVLLVVVLGGIAIGVGAYRAGERNGIAQGIEQVQTAQENGEEVQVVHVVDDGRGFFFPGFFLFPLFLFGLFFLIGGIFRGAGRFGWRRPRTVTAGPGTTRAGAGSRSGPGSGTQRQHGEAPTARGDTGTA